MFRHALGSPSFEPIYNDKDELYDLEMTRSRDKQFLFAESSSTDVTEYRYLPAATQASFAVFLPRRPKHRYYVHHREGLFYIRTNKDNRDFAIMTATEDHRPEDIGSLSCRQAVAR